LTRRVFATAGVEQAIEFVDTDFDAPPRVLDHYRENLSWPRPARTPVFGDEGRF